MNKTVKLYCAAWILALLWGTYDDKVPKWIPKETYSNQATCERARAAEMRAQQNDETKIAVGCFPIEMFVPK